MKIVCLGDSLTYGDCVGRDECWVSLMQAQTDDEWVNCGICGDTANGMLARLRHDVIDAGADVAIIMGGINDIIVSNSSLSARSSMMGMFLQCVNAGITPVLGIPCPPVDITRTHWPIVNADLMVPETEAYLEWLEVFARSFGFKTIKFEVPAEHYAEDGLHPNAEGHKLMAEAVMKWRTKFKKRK